MTDMQTDPSQAVARKRRKEILASSKTAKKSRTTSTPAVIIVGSEDEIKSDSNCSSKRTSKSSPVLVVAKRKLTCNSKVIKSNTKYQNRYEPEVPMSKEEEAEWRREARRQRNRESAAASRNKVRNRIQELEHEVQGWRTKYDSLMNRIELLEKETMPSISTINSTNSPATIQASPLSSPQTAPKAVYVPSSISSSKYEEHYDLSVPILPDCAASSDEPLSTSQNQQINVQSNVTQDVDLHVIKITSRPAESR